MACCLEQDRYGARKPEQSAWTGPGGNGGHTCSQSHSQDSEGAGSEAGTDCWVHHPGNWKLAIQRKSLQSPFIILQIAYITGP